MKPQDTGKTGNSYHIYGIDALRAFAIIGVFFYHLSPGILRGGFLGVDLFFMLTGFLLAVTGLNRIKNGTFDLKKYYFTRFKRIYPPLLLTSAVSAVFFIFTIPESLGKLNREFISIFFSYNNWWRIAQHASYFAKMSSQSPFTHLWFLSLEMQYYIVWPLLLLAFVSLSAKIKKRNAAYLFFAGAVISFVLMVILYDPSSDISRVYYGTDTRAFSILFGAFTGALYNAGASDSWPFAGLDIIWKMIDGTTDAAVRGIERKNNKVHRRHPFTEFLILILIILVLFFVMRGQSSFTYRGGLLLTDIFFMLLIALSSDRRLYIGDFLEKTPFTPIGRISYEIYLVHYPVIYYFKQKIPFKNSIISVIMTITVTLSLAVILHFITSVFFTEKQFSLHGRPAQKTSRGKSVRKNIDGADAAKTSKKTGRVTKVRRSRISHNVIFSKAAVRFIINRYTVLALLCVLAVNICGAVSVNSGSADDAKLMENELRKNSELIKSKNTSISSGTDAASRGSVFPASSSSAVSRNNNNIRRHRITLIGDSVMLSAAPALQKEFPDALIDAKVSRQLVQCTKLIQHYKKSGELGKAVILGLGTNGPFTQVQGQELIDAIGKGRIIYWVNTYGKTLSWQDEVNRMIVTLASENKNIHVIDWASLAVQHPEWFYNDGIHLKPSGQPAYAKLISGSVNF